MADLRLNSAYTLELVKEAVHYHPKLCSSVAAWFDAHVRAIGGARFCQLARERLLIGYAVNVDAAFFRFLLCQRRRSCSKCVRPPGPRYGY
jgi:hypothetical protein